MDCAPGLPRLRQWLAAVFRPYSARPGCCTVDTQSGLGDEVQLDGRVEMPRMHMAARVGSARWTRVRSGFEGQCVWCFGPPTLDPCSLCRKNTEIKVPRLPDAAFTSSTKSRRRYRPRRPGDNTEASSIAISDNWVGVISEYHCRRPLHPLPRFSVEADSTTVACACAGLVQCRCNGAVRHGHNSCPMA